MPIRQLLDQAVFNPEEILVLCGVFEETLSALNLSDRADPATTLVAKKIVDLARQGVRDPIRLRAATIEAFSENNGKPPENRADQPAAKELRAALDEHRTKTEGLS